MLFWRGYFPCVRGFGWKIRAPRGNRLGEIILNRKLRRSTKAKDILPKVTLVSHVSYKYSTRGCYLERLYKLSG